MSLVGCGFADDIAQEAWTQVLRYCDRLWGWNAAQIFGYLTECSRTALSHLARKNGPELVADEGQLAAAMLLCPGIRRRD